jgi:parallel beta-helix repeat protein
VTKHPGARPSSARGLQLLHGVVQNAISPKLGIYQCHARDPEGHQDRVLGFLELTGLTAARQLVLKPVRQPSERRSPVRPCRARSVCAQGNPPVDEVGSHSPFRVTVATQCYWQIRFTEPPCSNVSNMRGNKIHGDKACSVLVHDKGLGTLEDNDITGNIYAGVAITTGGNPTLRGNRINRNQEGLYIHDGGRGVVADNYLGQNKLGARQIAEDCKANMIWTGNTTDLIGKIVTRYVELLRFSGASSRHVVSGPSVARSRSGPSLVS